MYLSKSAVTLFAVLIIGQSAALAYLLFESEDGDNSRGSIEADLQPSDTTDIALVKVQEPSSHNAVDSLGGQALEKEEMEKSLEPVRITSSESQNTNADQSEKTLEVSNDSQKSSALNGEINTKNGENFDTSSINSDLSIFLENFAAERGGVYFDDIECGPNACSFRAELTNPTDKNGRAFAGIMRALPWEARLTAIHENKQSATFSIPNLIWPELSRIPHVAGRIATELDLESGSAAFILKSGDQYVGTPLAIEIPQYALFQGGARVVIVQAEQNYDGKNLIGAFNIQSKKRFSAPLEEFSLLGTNPQF